MRFGRRAAPEHETGRDEMHDETHERAWGIVPLGMILAVGVILALAALIRVPSAASPAWLGFDDGVYSASVLAMRAGGLPFRDVFSSQGPLFLPALWVADLVGLHAARAARLAMVFSGVLMTWSTYLVARRVAPRPAAIAAGALVAVSGTALVAAGPIQSDGLALALATLAIAVAATPIRPTLGRSIAIGVIVGAALAVKSLYVLPAVVTVGWLLAQRDRRGRIVPAAAAAAATGLLVSVPWGLANVWDQYVAFQLAIPRNRDPVANLSLVSTTLVRLDRLLVAVVVVAVAGALVRGLRSRATPGPRSPDGTRVMTRVPVVWLLSSGVVVIVLSEVNESFLRYVAFLVPPLAVLAAQLRPPLLVVAVVVAMLVPSHLRALGDSLEVRRPSAVESRAMRDLRTLAGTKRVVSDEPGLAWAAGLTMPPNLVDPSYNRIMAGYLDVGEVRTAIERDDVCGLLSWSGRFAALGPSLTDDLRPFRTYGDGQTLFVTAGCARTR